MLPLGPTGYGNSPYGLLSSFAGNPLLLSPERLLEDGLLNGHDLERMPDWNPRQVDFDALLPWKEALLRKAFGHFTAGARPDLASELKAFVEAQAGWLDDWALFAALKQAHGGRAWPEWQEPLARRSPEALSEARTELADEIRYHAFLQWLFDRQWGLLRQLAQELGIFILGDLPIYVGLDSADVWAAPHLWELDSHGRPLAVSGVPPDAFSAEGQLWGSPLYDWQAHSAEGFDWWARRLAAALRFTDWLRIDHFRGFAGYWRVPAGERTAKAGRWVKGPRKELFDAIEQRLGRLPLIAEDLGVITPDVERLLAQLEMPGMKVLQFAWGDPVSPYLPHRFEPTCVVYTATHDNETTRGWFAGAGPAIRKRATDYLGLAPGQDIEWAMIRAAYTSVARLAIVPLQDALGLGNEARMNTPGKETGNWTWRVLEGDIRHGLSDWLRHLAELSGRLPGEDEEEDDEPLYDYD